MNTAPSFTICRCPPELSASPFSQAWNWIQRLLLEELEGPVSQWGTKHLRSRLNMVIFAIYACERKVRYIGTTLQLAERFSTTMQKIPRWAICCAEGDKPPYHPRRAEVLCSMQEYRSAARNNWSQPSKLAPLRERPLCSAPRPNNDSTASGGRFCLPHVSYGHHDRRGELACWPLYEFWAAVHHCRCRHREAPKKHPCRVCNAPDILMSSVATVLQQCAKIARHSMVHMRTYKTPVGKFISRHTSLVAAVLSSCMLLILDHGCCRH